MNTITKAKQMIYLGSEYSGISIQYIKSRKVLYISGWYDIMVGIEGAEIELGDFLKSLGVSLKDCQNDLEKQNVRSYGITHE